VDQFELAQRALVGGKHATALRLLMPLANGGHPPAQTKLGELYRRGQGVARNYEDALIWFRKAASLGDGEAQATLGDMYYGGEGLARDDGKAAQWYHQAADQSLPDAQVQPVSHVSQRPRGEPRQRAGAYVGEYCRHLWPQKSAGHPRYPGQANDLGANRGSPKNGPNVAGQSWRPPRKLLRRMIILNPAEPFHRHNGHRHPHRR